MSAWVIIAIVGVVAVVVLCASVRILKQYERGVQLGAFLRHETEGAQRPTVAPPAAAAANGADTPLPGLAASWELAR